MHVPTVDDLITLPEPNDARISPGGTSVAYLVRQPGWDQNRYVSQIWVADVESGHPRQRVDGSYSSYAPRWTPDGHWITFFSQREEDSGPVLRRISPSSGRPAKLADLQPSAYAPAWAPTDETMAYIASVPETEVQRQQRERDGEVIVMGEETGRLTLWLLQMEDGTWQSRPAVTDLDVHVTSFAWHPAGGRIAFAARPSADEDDWDRGRIWVVDLATGEAAAVTPEGTDLPRWSPDGSHLTFSRLGSPSYIAINEICVVPGAGGEIRSLRPFDDETYTLAWGSTGIYLLALKGPSIHLFVLNPDDGTVTQLTPDDPPGWAITEGWIGLGCTFSQDFTRTAFVHYDITRRAEVAVLNLADSTVRHLTDFTEMTCGWQLGKPEAFAWTSTDGLPVEGILTKPTGFDPERPHPLVVVIHGGPTSTSLLAPLSDGDHWYGAIPQLVGLGALVLQPNYRGSSGYGEAFRALNVPRLGLVEYEDVISGVDALVDRGWADPERVGIIGMSHGGYLAAFAATYGDRFAAAVVLSGITDWVMNYVSTDTCEWSRQYLGATPWEDPGIYRDTSPMGYISRAGTPVLIQHGDRDDRVPIANANALYRGLRDRGVPVRLVIYPGMGHGISKPRQFRRLMEEVVGWFSRWLRLGESAMCRERAEATIVRTV